LSNSDGNIHAVIAAFHVWMIVVARDQQDVVVIAVRVRTQDGNFAEIVNLDRFSKLQAGTGRNQSVQVYDRTTALRQERICAISQPEIADNLL
jgi:hypothetical protein